MTYFQDLFAYDRSANERILAVCDGLSHAERTAPFPELGGSILELLGHIVGVQEAFLALLTGGAARYPENGPFGQVRAAFASVAEGYLEAIPELERKLATPVFIPWFKREITIEQALTQVATHSVQHRAGVAAGIARAGHEAPGLDFIQWVAAER
jgi:uncharacterized damage-inducible protein DinB